MACTFQVTVHGNAPDGTEPFAYLIQPSRVVAVLCDGLGCWGRGIEAAGAAAMPMLESLVSDGTDIAPFNRTFEIASRCAADYSPTATDETTTFDAAFSTVVASVSAHTVKLAWAGHSGALLVRDARVLERSPVRTLADDLAEAGAITREEASKHRLSRVTTNAISCGELPRIDSAEWSVQPCDRLYLGSDFHELAPYEIIDETALLKENELRTLLIVDIMGARQS